MSLMKNKEQEIGPVFGERTSGPWGRVTHPQGEPTQGKLRLNAKT